MKTTTLTLALLSICSSALAADHFFLLDGDTQSWTSTTTNGVTTSNFDWSGSATSDTATDYTHYAGVEHARHMKAIALATPNAVPSANLKIYNIGDNTQSANSRETKIHWYVRAMKKVYDTISSNDAKVVVAIPAYFTGESASGNTSGISQRIFNCAVWWIRHKNANAKIVVGSSTQLTDGAHVAAEVASTNTLSTSETITCTANAWANDSGVNRGAAWSNANTDVERHCGNSAAVIDVAKKLYAGVQVQNGAGTNSNSGVVWNPANFPNDYATSSWDCSTLKRTSTVNFSKTDPQWDSLYSKCNDIGCAGGNCSDNLAMYGDLVWSTSISPCPAGTTYSTSPTTCAARGKLAPCCY